MQKIIDTHVHIWDFDRAEYPWLKGDTSILNRTYAISEIELERIEVGITNGVFVQASCNLDDTNWMLKVAKNTDWINGVVCWLPLLNPEQTNKILNDNFLKNPYFKGVRHLIHDEENAEWLLQPTVIESLKLLAHHNIPYDVVGVLPQHIKTVLKVAEKIPNLRMVFDHLNAPPIASKQKFGEWGNLIKIAAEHKHFYAKISGLGTAGGDFSNRSIDDIKPYVTFALEHFDLNRCMCGGDWPVSLLANNYKTTWNNTKQILNNLLNTDQLNHVYFNTANTFYNLQIN